MVPRTTHEHIDIGGLAQDSIVSVIELAQSGTKPSIFLLLSTIPKLRKPGRDIEKKIFCRGEYFLGRG